MNALSRDKFQPQPSWLYYTPWDTYMGRKNVQKRLVAAIAFALTFAAVMAVPSVAAIKDGLTETLGENYFWQFLPIIVGAGVGAVYWAAISARRSR